ncbi:hypothetical protein NUW58_g5105 [Xylaria curta]|uniref:Uncharacterized protein n=1 Tax=Xylaria curta TaxID=42375 RepID=A0ACC1P4D8_9PEZI|nr:hypothetical protein NUW58_g5105 [Xylaria curta]
MRKRKPESQDNERLSKRLSLLNLEKNGHKLYVPVESPSVQSIPEHPGYRSPVQSPSLSAVVADDGMQLDNTKHKVYIYDLDAELSSADENSEGESLPGSPTSGRGRLVFLPDIEKHMYRTRIPPAVLANKEGELAGHDINDMQMVLYSEPSSLTVPREHDSVRKAVLEARARMRQKQKDRQAETEQEPRQPKMTLTPPVIPSPAVSFPNFGHANGPNITTNGFGGVGATDLIQNATPWRDGLVVDDDVDAMDMD